MKPPEKTSFTHHRGITVYVDENGVFSIEELPISPLPQPYPTFKTAKAALAAIDADVNTARAKGRPVLLFSLSDDKPVANVVVGLHAGRGVLVCEDGGHLTGSYGEDRFVYPTKEDAELVAKANKEARGAAKAAAVLAEKVGISLPRLGRVGTEGVPVEFSKFVAKAIARGAAEAAK